MLGSSDKGDRLNGNMIGFFGFSSISNGTGMGLMLSGF